MYGWSINIGSESLELPCPPPVPQGVCTGTLVAGETGWRAVETLMAGDRVWTFDNGLQKVLAVEPVPARTFGAEAIYRVPAGALANARDMQLLPGQGLLLECETAQDAMGDPFAVIPIDALDGVCGIHSGRQPRKLILYRLTFAQEEAIYIDGGLPLHCPGASQGAADAAMRYDVKSVDVARAMLTDLDYAELALREADESFFGETASERVA